MDRLSQRRRGQVGANASDAPLASAWRDGEVDFGGAMALRPGADSMPWLVRAIETEIIPRLMLAHQSARQPARAGPGAAAAELPTCIGIEHVNALTARVLGDDPHACSAYVGQLRAQGIAIDAIYLELLGPVARRLGAMWEADTCDFTQVTVGLWRLQHIVYEHGPAFWRRTTSKADPSPRRRVILMPVPGSQHTMGALLLGEFFRRAGWEVWGEACSNARDAMDEARNRHVDVAGFSIGSECHIALLAGVIADLRRVSRNRTLCVLVGGPILAARPDIVSLVGADATAADAPAAVALAERLVGGVHHGERCR